MAKSDIEGIRKEDLIKRRPAAQAIARSFVEKEGDKDYGRITVVDGATHAKGWRERWKDLLSLRLNGQ